MSRGDHEVVCLHGMLIPVLGTVGGTAQESHETARNIERFLAADAACSHKFIDSRSCLKCGWTPPQGGKEVA